MKRYGLRDVDLNELIIIVKLKDISSEFSEPIDEILGRFKSPQNIRILEFNELSGGNREANYYFNATILAQKHLFHDHLSSNQRCCVIYRYAGYRYPHSLFRARILPHEFAHHHQFAEEKMPCVLPKDTPQEYWPQFTTAYEVGPRMGRVYIDDSLLDQNTIALITDLRERIADLICERILIGKGYTHGMKEQFHIERGRGLPPLFAKQLGQYVRRLALYDAAQWHAVLQICHPRDRSLRRQLAREKKRVLLLNEYSGAEQRHTRGYVSLV